MMLDLITSNMMNPYVGAFSVGLLSGSTVCTFACSSYLVTYTASRGRGFRAGVENALMFGIGRVLVYSLLGFLTGISSGFLNASSYKEYVPMVFGIVVILIGINLFFKKASCNFSKIRRNKPPRQTDGHFDSHAFLMGLTLGFLPCAPLVGILLYSATFLSLTESVILACLFGLGTLVSPLLPLCGMASWITNLAQSETITLRKWIPRIGGTILVLMGVSILLNPLITSI
jgi:sulfite exporter TauE/SafE